MIDDEFIHDLDALVRRQQIEMVTRTDGRGYRILVTGWKVDGPMLQFELPWPVVVAAFTPRELNERESVVALAICDALEDEIRHTDNMNQRINASMGQDSDDDPEYAKDAEIRAVIDRLRDLLGVQP